MIPIRNLQLRRGTLDRIAGLSFLPGEPVVDWTDPALPGLLIADRSGVARRLVADPGPHSHAIAGISGLQAALEGKAEAGHSHAWNAIADKPAAFAPAAHQHGDADLTGLAWSKLTGVPSTFAPAAHTHAFASLTSLPTTLAGYGITDAALASHTHTLAALGAAAASHQHSDADLTSLAWSKLTGIPSTFAPASHALTAHTASGLTTGYTLRATGASTFAWGQLQWGDIGGKPSTFTPSAHSHAISEVTGLQTALDGKAASSHSHTFANLTALPTTLAGYGISDAALASHTHTLTALGAAAAVHAHTIGDVSELQAALDGKAATSHLHTGTYEPVIAAGTASQVWKGSKAWGSVDWSELTGKPSTFAPASHALTAHTASGLTTGYTLRATGASTFAWAQLQWGDIGGVPTIFPPAAHSHGDADLTGLAWSKLTGVPTSFTPSAHTHAAYSSYDFNLTCTPKPAASQKLLIHTATRAFRVASTGHTGKCHVNPTTSSAVLTLKKNGTQFGTLTFSTAGVFSMSVTQMDFAIGDILTVEAPSSQNSTFADFGATIVATVL